MVASVKHVRIYEGDGNEFMARERSDPGERIILVPDALPRKAPNPAASIRIVWGQHLLDDLAQGRYHSLICAVNVVDNSRGIITQLASILPAARWNERSITAHAAKFASDNVRIVKYDMDLVETLAIVRPPGSPFLTLEHLACAFEIISEMIRHRSTRMPTASVSFLGARANMLVENGGQEPSFEKVLHTMYEAGYRGDVYPSPAMWMMPQIGLFPRYPFPESLNQRREGGY